jgi:bifunctional non-homologous end joining protein LigD
MSNMSVQLPREPMAPIASDTLPQGDDWGYELKWDGVRLLSVIDNGRVELISRSMLSKGAVYPEIVRLLSGLKGRVVLDGEAVAFNLATQKPDFASILKRERSRKGVTVPAEQTGYMVLYVLFDLLQLEDRDLRELPLAERRRLLLQLFPQKQPTLFVTDQFRDGQALWAWVEQHGWEGVVSKRLSSPYREGKRHQDWYKKKTAVTPEVDIVGLTIRDEQVASLVMEREGSFFGKVSLGLTVPVKRRLLEWGLKNRSPLPGERYASIPGELKGEQVLWLERSFKCTVTGLEVTSAGLLRHPKLVAFDPGDGLGIFRTRLR